MQLLTDLSPFRRGGIGVEKMRRLRQRSGNTTLIHNAAAFLFQLHKNLILGGGDTVAAQPQLFLIDGLFQRGTDQPIIFGIAVDVADGVFAVAVGGHVPAHLAQQGFHLRGRNKVFLFDAPEAELCGVCHIGHSFRI